MRQYIVDAFTDSLFSGNPAAICISDHWLPDHTMQQIALENHLSETAFAVPEMDFYRLRWFTPGGEIDLCGHATLACGYIILTQLEPQRQTVEFQTLSGQLTVTKCQDRYEMDFPAYSLQPVPVTQELIQALGAQPQAAYLGRDLLCVFDQEQAVRQLQPDLASVQELPGLLLHVTAPGQQVDCVSRTFAPKCNVPEDAVCGSGHCHIVPYWAATLQKPELIAYQASQRGGTLYCRLEGDRVKLGGKAVIYAISELFIA